MGTKGLKGLLEEEVEDGEDNRFQLFVKKAATESLYKLVRVSIKKV